MVFLAIERGCTKKIPWSTGLCAVIKFNIEICEFYIKTLKVIGRP